MTFEESVKKLLQAIEKKNIKALSQLLPTEGPIAAIMCDGTVLEDTQDYLDFHEEWFDDEQWSITHEIVFSEESPQMGYSVVETEYFDKDDDVGSYSLVMFTTCIMRHVEGKWILVHFQQTEVCDD